MGDVHFHINMTTFGKRKLQHISDNNNEVLISDAHEKIQLLIQVLSNTKTLDNTNYIFIV